MADDLEFDPQLAASGAAWSINDFLRRKVEGSLILRPTFQRQLVWNLKQQSFLIDSILRGMPVPELYVQVETSPDGSEQTLVVDGQQRLTACLDFLEGDLVLANELELDERWRGRRFDGLDPGLQVRFRSYELLVRKLPSVGDAQLREIFRRLNRTNEALQPQELRHAAYPGPFLDFIESVSVHPVLRELGVFSPRDYLRRRNDELIAEISLALVTGVYPNKKEHLDEMFLTFDRQGVPDGLLEDLSARFSRVLSQIRPIAPDLRKTRFRNKSDFYTLTAYLGMHADRLPVGEDLCDRFGAELVTFANDVDNLKRAINEGANGDELPSGERDLAVLSYLSSVERAASDRGSRVKRHEALDRILAPLLAECDATPFSAAEATWRPSADLTDEELEDEETEAERRVVEGVLNTPGEDADD